jgi:hypothetical protein
MQKFSTVDEFLKSLDNDKRAQVEALRAIILSTTSNLTEHIKWNASSYVLDGEDRITFNLINKEGVVKLVLHMGATRKENKKGDPVLKDATGLIEWSSDIRGVLSFEDLADIQSKRSVVARIIKDWLAIRP